MNVTAHRSMAYRPVGPDPSAGTTRRPQRARPKTTAETPFGAGSDRVS